MRESEKKAVEVNEEMTTKPAKAASRAVQSTREQLHSGSLLLGLIIGGAAVAAVVYASKTGVLAAPPTLRVAPRPITYSYRR